MNEVPMTIATGMNKLYVVYLFETIIIHTAPMSESAIFIDISAQIPAVHNNPTKWI